MHRFQGGGLPTSLLTLLAITLRRLDCARYSFAEAFGLGTDGVTPVALAGLVERMALPNSPAWEAYRGAPNGTLFCRGWLADAGKADSHCEQPCVGNCKAAWLHVLNGTGTAARNAA